MKNFTLFFLLIVLVCPSCKDDDGGNTGNTDYAELVIGEWLQTNSTVNGEVSTGGLYDVSCISEFSHEFNNNGTMSRGFFEEGNCPVAVTAGTYTISGNTISIETAFTSTEYIIESMNESSFIFTETLLNSNSETITRRITCTKVE